MIDVRAKAALFMMRRLRRLASCYASDIHQFRIQEQRFFKRLPMPKGVQQRYRTIAGLRAAEFTPKQLRQPHKIVLYLHGGGYSCGSVDSYASLMARFAKETGIVYLGIDYRLAPEHPFPAALDDALAAYQWLLDEGGYAAHEVVVMGDSAGGGLGLALLLRLKELGQDLPLCAVALSPWTDLAMTGASVKENAHRDPLLDPSEAGKWSRWYAGEAPLEHPLISPLYGDLSGLPPLLLHVGTEEVLYNDATRLLDKAKSQGTEATLWVGEGMPHVWHFMWRFLPQAKEAIAQASDFIHGQILAQERRAASSVSVE